MEILLPQLYREREALKKAVHDHKLVLSPIREIPTELMHEIFTLAEDSSVTLDTKAGPWRIAQVSKRWRAVAVTLPRLWSTISVTVNANLTLPTFALSILHTIISRADTSLLDIVFDVSGSLIAQAGPLLEYLAAVSHRWRSFNFRGSYEYVKYLAQVEGKVPELEAVKITMLNQPGVRMAFHMFQTAPKLRKVYFDETQHLGLVLPWTQITHLDPGATGAYSLDLMKKCTNLTELRIRGGDERSPVFTWNRIRYQHLCYLRLSEGSRILNHFSLPALTGLHFRGELTRSVVEDLTQLFRRAPCRLTQLKLTLSKTATTPTSLFKLLSPTLTEFDLTYTQSGKGIDDIVFHLLSLNRTHDGYIFPFLSSLKVDISDSGIRFPVERFVNAITSRTTLWGRPEDGSCLETLHFRFHPTAEPLTLATIENLPLLYTP